MGSPAVAGDLPRRRRPMFLLRLLLIISFTTRCRGDGNVGCLFSPELCAEGYEWCFDDYAFGRCLPLYGHVDEDYLYRRELGPAELQALEGQMTRLFAEGFRWSHAYTQCVMQASLRAVQLGEELEEEPDTECEPLAEREVEVKVPDLEPQDLAFVRFTPSADNPHAEFADETYFPPLERQHGPAGRPVSTFAAELRALEGPMVLSDGPVKKAEHQPRFFHAIFNTPDSFRRGEETRDHQPPASQPEAPPAQPAYTEGGLVFVQAPNGENNEVEEGRVTAADEEEARLEAILEQYGGLDWGFKRRERLDVKKPGPPFLTNSYAYKTEEASASPLKSHQERALPQPVQGPPPTPKTGAKPKESNEIPEVVELKPPPPRRRPPPPPQPPALQDDVDNRLEFVDPSYAYVGFKHSVRSWKQGAEVVNLLADLLNLDRSELSNVRVDLNEVTFKVEEPNSQGLNASEVARQVDSLKGKLKEILGVEVTAAGIGDKTKLPSMVAVGSASETEERLLILSVLACVLGAVAVAAAALLLVRRHSRSKEKLQALAQPDNEASKDYQELCRARMAAKQQQSGDKGAEGPVQRVVNLSRESEASNNSPSSRSSTSSWSEEPALSNMDISTGHMVLSYMEDHLHNKGRLEQEWVALCAYEAEPCATTIAFQTDNAPKNRYPDVVPYDHSRVVLNALANSSGSDYINASSITDHDPRNPAYIATQGPLPTTAADFWQMVWEQGSVVMVMLSRLTENGITMCHRYWPEEGSELYHVYEVHLVSEHIWCDDYLVRSFYLKNVKTGETRTVTQFHFLSWPEGGVPTSTKALLEFRRKVNKSYRGRSCPIVVHCSDGAGRTGTYCLMDMVLNRMAKGAKEIDIAATLEHIRDQRGGMVRTKAQFELVLMAVAEEVHAILKALPQ